MVGRAPVGGHPHHLEAQLVGVRRQRRGVALADAPALALHRVALLQLAEEVGGEHVGEAERGAGVLPGVLVDLAEHEGVAVGALVVEHAGAVDVLGVVEQERAALAADEVLGLVEAEGGEAPQAAERLAPPACRRARARCPPRAAPPASRPGRRGSPARRTRRRRSARSRPPARARRGASRGVRGPGPACRGSMSQKSRPAPCRANARPVLVKVNDGTMTVSPSCRSISIADSSRAAVHEVVISTSARAGVGRRGARRSAARRRLRTTGGRLAPPPGRSRARGPPPTATLKGMSGSSAAGPSSGSCACATAGTSLSSFVSSRVTTAAASRAGRPVARCSPRSTPRACPSRLHRARVRRPASR